MPNLNSVPDSPEHLTMQEAMIAEQARVRVCPYGAISVGERGEQLVNLCGVELDNPVIPASGTFGYGWEFAELYDINI